MRADEFESNSVSTLLSDCSVADKLDILRLATESICSAISAADASSSSTVRSSLSGWWRAIGTILETAGQSIPATHTSEIIARLPFVFGEAKNSLDTLLVSNNFDFSSKDTVMVYSGLYLAYTSVVRCFMDHIALQADHALACELMLGIESVLPMDNKGISNVYKRLRSVEQDKIIADDTDMQPSFVDFNSSLEITVDDMTKSYEKFWKMMHESRCMDADILTDTKAWGRFSQAASATMNILVEQSGENLESLGPSNLLDPTEYLQDPSSFGVQLSSSSFRRRAMLNMLFTCAYVVNNSTNVLITAGARNLYGNLLKSMPQKLHTTIDTLMRFENHWVAWKSSVHSKEVCGPFEPLSRIERGLRPFDQPVDISGESDEEEVVAPTPVLMTPAASITNLASYTGDSKSHNERIIELMTEYRQYVRDAILCDISDEHECERLSASDVGMEEAMARNGDRVFLWQFKRMRFKTNISSFAKIESVFAAPDEAMDSPAEQPSTEEEYVVVPDHE